MANKRTAQDLDRERRTRAFAKAHAKAQKRCFPKRIEDLAMTGLGAQMPGDRMIERSGLGFLEARGGRRADEPVEDDRDPVGPRPCDGSGHGCQLAPAEAAQQIKRRFLTVAGDARFDDLALDRQPVVIDARAASGPAARITAEKRSGQRSSRCRIADPHLARDNKIRPRFHRLPSGGEGRDALRLAHRGAGREVGSRCLKRQRMHIERRSGKLGKLVDRSTASVEIGDHLGRDLGGKGRHASRGDAVIARKDKHLRHPAAGRGITAPADIPLGQILEPAQRTRWLGQLGVAVPGSRSGLGIGAGQSAQNRVKFGERREGSGHFHPSLQRSPLLFTAGHRKGKAALIELADIARALGLLTRLPVRVDAEAAMARGARAAWAWPLVGLLLGGLAAGAGYGAALFWSSPFIGAIIAAGLMTVLTGAMHEDGLADCADGFFGSHDRERRLAIMKDSQIGTFGVMALGLVMLLKIAALSLLLAEDGLPLALIAAAMLSRAGMVLLMRLPNARADGLSRAVGTPPGSTAGLAVAIAGLGALLCLGWPALGAFAVAVLAVSACAAIARSKIGGQTGDVLGASQQIGEVAVLLTLAAL